MKHKILLVEDSEVFTDLVRHTLENSFEIILATNLESALKSLKENQFDLVLLDVGLPDGDGFHFFSMLLNDNNYKRIPVIFLTADSNVSSKVLGITLGAEDYIVKPIEPAEFKARIQMRIKKNILRQKAEKLLRKGELEINLNAQRAFRFEDDKKTDLQLTPFEFKLLVILSTHENQVFSRDQLFDKVWGTETHLTDRCVDTHIYWLRKKLGSLAYCIRTVYGEGYRFSLDTLIPKKQGAVS